MHQDMEEKFLSSSHKCLVVACCTTLFTFMNGIAMLSGILFVVCMERYDVGRKDASFPFSLCYITRSLSGPLVGYLGRRFGAEDVTILGSVIAVVGVGACFFAEDITAIIILWGCLFGLGFGLGTTLLPEILRLHFTKHYDKANGVVTGGGIAFSLLLPVIADTLLNAYGTSGTFLVLSGLMMQTLVAAVILKNFERRRNTSKVKSNPVTTVTVMKSNQISNVKELKRTSMEAFQEQNSHRTSEDTLRGTRKPSGDDPPEANRKSEAIYETFTVEGKPSTTTMLCQKNEDSESKKSVLLDMLLLFLDPAFIIISLTQCITAFTFIVLFTVIVDFSKDVGVSADHEVIIFTGLVAGNIIGRLLLGFITDSDCVSKKTFTASCYIFLGILIPSLCAVHGSIMLITAVCVIGLFIGGQTMIGSGIVLLYIESDKIVLTFACRMFIYPLLGFAQPYVIAYFRDTLGSYNGLFYLLAVANIVSGLLTMLLPLTTRCKEKGKHTLEKD